MYEDTPLRAYWNLDNSPRVWGFGHSALDVLRMFGDSDLKMILNILEVLKRISKGVEQKIDSIVTLSSSISEFDPYDLWIVDGTKGFHKIIYGKSMISQNLTLSRGCSQKLDSALNYRTWIGSPGINL